MLPFDRPRRAARTTPHRPVPTPLGRTRRRAARPDLPVRRASILSALDPTARLPARARPRGLPPLHHAGADRRRRGPGEDGGGRGDRAGGGGKEGNGQSPGDRACRVADAMEGGAGLAAGSAVDRRARRVAANDHSRTAPGREPLVDSGHLPGVHRLRQTAGGARPPGIGALGSPRRGRGTWRDARHRPARCSRCARLPGLNRRLAVRHAAFRRAEPVRRPLPHRERRGTLTARLLPPDACRHRCGAGPCPQPRVRGASNRKRAPDAPAARTLHVAVVGSGAARQREPGAAGHGLSETRALQRRRSGRLAGPAAVLDGLPAARRSTALAATRKRRHRRGGRRGRRQRARRQRASTIPSASGRFSSSVSRPPRPHPSPKAKQRDSFVSFPGSTPPPSFFPNTAIRRCGCAPGLRPWVARSCCCTVASPRTSAPS